MYDLVVDGTLNLSSLTPSFFFSLPIFIIITRILPFPLRPSWSCHQLITKLIIIGGWLINHRLLVWLVISQHWLAGGVRFRLLTAGCLLTTAWFWFLIWSYVLVWWCCIHILNILTLCGLGTSGRIYNMILTSCDKWGHNKENYYLRRKYCCYVSFVQ